MFLSMPDLSYFRLLDGSCELFLLLDQMPKSFPTSKIIEIFLFCIGTQVMGSSATITLKGSKVIPPVSHSICTLYLLLSNWDQLLLEGLHDQLWLSWSSACSRWSNSWL